MAFYQDEDIKFKCTHCGECCKGKGSYVFITVKEAQAISRNMGIAFARFKGQYVEVLVDGELVLTQHDNGDCVFLNSQQGCEIYKSRPAQCSTYPFWPEIMSSSEAWRDESRRCEGIDTGDTVPLEKIIDALSMFDEE